MGAEKKIKAIDLFAGAGGFSLGFEHSGIEVVAAIEFNSKIATTYAYNHPQTKMIVEDIRNIDNERISSLFSKDSGKCDIVFGGPPCQGFSMAGYRIRTKTPFLDDPRNMLFKEYIRVVSILKPKVFVIENVPGILNYNKGAIKDEIFTKFDELGYSLYADVLCAADYGVPQIRQRAIIIGNRIGINSKDLFPQKKLSSSEYISVNEAISDLPPLKAGEGKEIDSYCNDIKPTNYQKMMRSPNNLFYNHISSHHSEETLKILPLIHQGQTMKDLPEAYHTKSVHSGAYGRMEGNKPSYTLTTRLNTPSVGRITHPTQDRTITPREAARIQSFPDSYRFIGDITSVGMQIGNAVPPIMAEAIGNAIVDKLNKNHAW